MQTYDVIMTPSDDGCWVLKSEADKVISQLKDKLKVQTSSAEEAWKLKNSYHDSYAESVKDLYDKNKVIAELKADYEEACGRLQTANLIKDEQLAAARHHKYKRCLAMANWCEATALWCYQAANTLPVGIHATLYGKPVMIEPKRLFNRFELLNKWNKRWMELSEIFKEAK